MRLLQKKSLRKKLTEKFGGSLQFVIIRSKADNGHLVRKQLLIEATEDEKDPKEKLICAAVFVGYSKAWWSPLNLQRYGDSAYSGKYFLERLFLPSN